MELASRASYRGQVTKLVNSATEYLRSDDSKLSENRDNLEAIEEELEVSLDRLTAAHECLRKANQDVISSIKETDMTKEADLVAEYDDKAIAVITRIKHRLVKVRQQQAKLTATAENINETENASHNITTEPPPSRHAAHGAVKLQKLQPKKFSGDFREWVPFWEQYRALIHENSSLSTIDKFNYLETVLTGKATETLVGLTPTEENYNAAIAILKEEYGNNEKLVDYTMQRLLSIQPVSSKADVIGLRRLYTSVLASTRSLAALGIPSSNYYVMLKGVLLRCLPNELRVDFHRYYGDSAENNDSRTDYADDDASIASVSEHSSTNMIGDKQVKCLLKFLKREVESLEKANEAKLTTNTHTTRVNVLNQRTVKTAVGLFTSETKNGCSFCKAKTHDTKDCCSAKSIPDKKLLLKTEGRCYRCCKVGHNSRTCRVGVKCKTCSGRHATSMCDPLFIKNNIDSSSSTVNRTDNSVTTSSKASTTQSSLNLYAADPKQRANVYLQTACAFACSEHSFVPLYVRVVMDGGSQLSFVKSSVARRLNLPIIGVNNLSVIPFGSDKPRPSKMCNKVRLLVRSQHDDQAVVIDAIEVPEICCDVLSVPTNDSTVPFRDLILADARIQGQQLEEGISILIGADTYWQFATGNHRRLTDRLVAVETVLGWTIQGPLIEQSTSAGSSYTTSLHVCVCEDVQKFWNLDIMGISPEDNKGVSSDLSLHIRRNGNRYEVSLPWKNKSTVLHDNRPSALVRMQSLVRKLCSAGRISEYSAAMREMLSSGIAEIVPETSVNEKRIYYLPHRPVYREDKETTKLRIVFDASAHAPNHSSLNDCLEVGPNLLPELLIILLNFRIGKIALIADIEKAFLQILLDESDRDSHRFFWFSDKINDERDLPAVQIFRMTRLTFGVTSSPFLLAATLQRIIEEAKEKYPRTCERLLKAFYMDDFVVSVDTEEIAGEIYREANLILKSASMTLRKWNCNNESIRQSFSMEDRLANTQKVLGLRWVVATDELEVDLDPVMQLLKSGSLQTTKRGILKVMAKVFDPFGILAPWTVRLKILFQNIWRRKLEWDAKLPEDLQSVWTACCNEIDELNEIAIPRHLLTVYNSTEVHIFADASQFAFGAAAYARTVDNNGQVSVHLICAKNRVAPLKNDHQNELTVPKLELTAALIGARLLAYLRNNLQIQFSATFLWSDSQITLFWIQGLQKRWKPYIESRVKEIRALTDVSSWRHCPGADNPADLLTRGISATSLVNSSTWFNGPHWLLQKEINWASSNSTIAASLCALSSNTEELEIGNLEDDTSPIINAKKFSDWKRLLRVTAYILRAVAIMRKHKFPKYLSAEEINRAEKYWIHRVQRQYYPEEIAALRKKKGIPSKSKLITLSPFLDAGDEFLRVGGRLQFVVANVNEAHPIILPKSSHVTELIVIHAHEKAFHGGTSSTLSRLRSIYWIVKGRQLIKNIIKKCYVCKVLRGSPATQIFAPLPRDRILSSRPFEVIGMDFAGPLYVTDDAKHRKKIYILLFTCAGVRAVHIESTMDLTTESCLLAIRRFIARRGVPRIIYSDNATTFKRASSELRKINDIGTNERFLGFLSNSHIKWKFIVERAPWWGGFWERLIGVVKSALRAAIGKAVLNADQFQTLLTEVEGVVNMRPLTYAGDDPLDLAPLTPAHFLIGANGNFAESVYEQPSGKELRKQWKERLRFLAGFKKRWYKEYLLQLRSLHHVQNPLSSSIRVGDVVLLEDSSLPRTLWHLAVIKKCFPGRDGKIRACEIRLASGSILRRPIQLLYPLEIHS